MGDEQLIIGSVDESESIVEFVVFKSLLICWFETVRTCREVFWDRWLCFGLLYHRVDTTDTSHTSIVQSTVQIDFHLLHLIKENNARGL